MIENTDFSKSEQYTLSIRLSTDGFSFSLFNPLSNEEAQQVYEYAIDDSLPLTANLKKAFREIEWLRNSFRRVTVLIASKRNTYLPLDYFEDEQCETILYQNHPKRENEVVLYNIVRQNNIVVLFGLDKTTHRFLLEQYPEAKFYAQTTPLLEFFANKSRQGNCHKLYAHFHKEHIDVFAFERGRLQLANSLACKETSDQLYYLLYIWKQLGLEQERDELHLTGRFNNKEELLSELRKYIKQVFIMNPATNLDFQAIIACE